MRRFPHNLEKLPGKRFWTIYGGGFVWRACRSVHGDWFAIANASGYICERADTLTALAEKIGNRTNSGTHACNTV